MNLPGIDPSPAPFSEPPALADLQSLDARTSAAAWDQAFPLLWDAALRLLRSKLLVGAQHEHSREDIAAHAIEQVTRGVIEKQGESFNQLASFDDVIGMTHRIVRTRVIDFFRHQGRRPEVVTDEVPELSDSDPGGAESDTALTREEMDKLLARLPPPQPEIFHDHYVLGQTASEIAGKRQLSRNTVLSHLHRGKKTLRNWLGDTAGTLAREAR